jgi:hypothetical protein
MSSGPAGKTRPARRGRRDACICADSCGIQEPLDVAGGSIYDNAFPSSLRCSGEATRTSDSDHERRDVHASGVRLFATQVSRCHMLATAQHSSTFSTPLT